MKSILSPKITELTDQLSNGDTQAFHTFLDELKANGTPFIETCPMNNQYHLITYIWIGNEDTENVYIFGSYPGWDLNSNQLEQLLDTNLWYKTFRTNETFISTYHFSVNDHFEHDWIARSKQYQLDSFNRNIFGKGTDKASVLEMGMEMQYDRYSPHHDNFKGEIETYSFYSSILGNTRKIYVYTPHNYSHTVTLQDLLIAFNGNTFMQNLSAPATLEHLIHKQKIPSCIVIGIEHVDRLNELTYNDKMNAFLIEELLPWIQTKYHVYKDPAHATIAGLSLGGLAAFYAALKNPHTFGNVLSLSGSVHWKKDGYEDNLPWIEKQFLSIHHALRLRMYMAAGTLENERLLKANRSLSKTLGEKEYQKDIDKALKKQEILVKDEKVWSYTYEDHIGSIIKRAEKSGAFDDLPGKGKPLNIDKNLSYNPEKQLYKTLKDNHVLPRWIELSKEIDHLKEKLKEITGSEETVKLIETINKKVSEHNLLCPPTAQKMRAKTDF